MSRRTCSWCGRQGVTSYCPDCVASFPRRPVPATMTPQARVDELQSIVIVEVPFDLIHGRIEALLGRPVWTHELAGQAGMDRLCNEILSGKTATIGDVLDAFPADKPVIIVEVGA